MLLKLVVGVVLIYFTTRAEVVRPSSLEFGENILTFRLEQSWNDPGARS